MPRRAKKLFGAGPCEGCGAKIRTAIAMNQVEHAPGCQAWHDRTYDEREAILHRCERDTIVRHYAKRFNEGTRPTSCGMYSESTTRRSDRVTCPACRRALADEKVQIRSRTTAPF